MPKKRKKNLRREIAEHNYIDPESKTYLNMSQSLIKAGYSPKYANTKSGKVLGNINYQDLLPDSVENPQDFAKRCYTVLLKLVTELEETPKLTRISAKYIAEIRRTLELLAKMFGMVEPEKKEVKVIKIEIPQEIVKQEYERREQHIDLDIDLSKDIKLNKEKNKKNI